MGILPTRREQGLCISQRGNFPRNKIMLSTVTTRTRYTLCGRQPVRNLGWKTRESSGPNFLSFALMHTLTHYQLYGCAYPSDGIKNMNEHTEGYSGHKGQVLFVSWGLEIFPPTFWVFWFPNFPNYCAPMRIPPTRQEQRLCISQGKIKRTSSYCSNNMGSYVRSLKVNQLMVKVL